MSTTSSDDLNTPERPNLQFSPDLGIEHADAMELLKHPFRWFLTREFGGCSCHFRHAMPGAEPLFGPLEPWQEVDEDDLDDLEATRQAYDHFRDMLMAGHRLDVMSVWSGAGKEDVISLEVNLADLAADHFRFGENLHFLMTPAERPRPKEA